MRLLEYRVRGYVERAVCNCILARIPHVLDDHIANCVVNPVEDRTLDAVIFRAVCHALRLGLDVPFRLRLEMIT